MASSPSGGERKNRPESIRSFLSASDRTWEESKTLKYYRKSDQKEIAKANKI
jgi:hypothetical protein